MEENLLFSKDNMEFNLDKFNGDNNILYITGLCGSGKSTIIKKYAEKYNAEQLEFDAITSALTKGLDNLNKNKIHPIILEYLTTQNPTKLKNFSDANFGNECVKFLDWFEKKVYGNGKLYILEGMQIFLCFDPKRFIGKPMVVMGTSVAKSMYRNVSRKYKRTGDIQKTFKHFIATLNRTNIIIKNDRQISELVDVISESYNHYITLNINNNMSNGLYGFRDNVSSISFDNNHLKRVNHKLQQVEESCIDKENTTEIKIGYNGDIKPIINKNSNQGAFLLWNKKDSINTLLESISKEWFDSKLTIDDFHIIGGDNNVW